MLTRINVHLYNNLVSVGLIFADFYIFKAILAECIKRLRAFFAAVDGVVAATAATTSTLFFPMM